MKGWGKPGFRPTGAADATDEREACGEDSDTGWPAQRAGSLASMAEHELDVLCGRASCRAGTALDAATRACPRAWSRRVSGRRYVQPVSKLIHGGLRYLEMLDFVLVREALKERGCCWSGSPRSCAPVPSCTRCSTSGWSASTPGAGVALYDTMAMARGDRRARSARASVT
ncbi:hypothetical protein GCM10023238_18670 [Streptomyces heliomycini]